MLGIRPLIITLGLVCVALAAAQAPARAESAAAPADPCHCEQYKGFTRFTSLADEIAEVGPRAARATDGTVSGYGENGQAEIAALRLRISSDALIPQECKDKLMKDLSHVRVTLFGRLIAGNSSQQNVVGAGSSQSYLGDYQSAWNSYQNNQYFAQCGGNFTTACMQAASAAAWPQFGKALMANPGAVGLGGASASEIQVLGAFQGVLASGSESAALAYLRSQAKALGTAQYMALVQLVGLQLGEDYDNSRNGTGPASQGIVTGDQLLAAASSNEEYGTNLRAGVCRDIATLQAKMLEAGGFPNSYVLTYGLPGDFHAIAIAGDPSNPTQFHTFNYNIGTNVTGMDGGAALLQMSSVQGVGVPDTTLYYNLVKPEGASVAAIPSEMSKFLQEASGFDLRQIDPLARETTSMMGAEVTFSSDSGRVSATTRIVAGQDGVGAQYIGGAETVRYGQGTITPGQVGLFIGQQFRPASVYGTTADEKALIGYLEAEQHVAPKVKLGDHATLTIDSSVNVSGAIGEITQGVGPTGAYVNGIHEGQSKGLPFFGGDLFLRSEARVDQTSADGRLHSTYRAGVEVSPGVQDVRIGNPVSDPTVELNSVYAGTTQTLKVGDMALFGSVTAAADMLGSRGLAEVGAAGSKWAVSAYIAGRITNGTALYEDNTIRRAGLSATFRPIPQLQLGVTGEMPIEGDAPLAQAHLMGTAIVAF